MFDLNSERTLGTAGFNQVAFGVILPFSAQRLNKLGLNDEIDISRIPIGPGFGR